MRRGRAATSRWVGYFDAERDAQHAHDRTRRYFGMPTRRSEKVAREWRVAFGPRRCWFGLDGATGALRCFGGYSQRHATGHPGASAMEGLHHHHHHHHGHRRHGHAAAGGGGGAGGGEAGEGGAPEELHSVLLCTQWEARYLNCLCVPWPDASVVVGGVQGSLTHRVPNALSARARSLSLIAKERFGGSKWR